MGAIPGSREPSPSSTGLGPSGFDPERVKLCTSRQLIRNHAQRFRGAYVLSLDTPAAWKPGWTKRKIADALDALDVETVTVAEIETVQSSTGWVTEDCDLCRATCQTWLHIGEEPDYEARWLYVCLPCAEHVGAIAAAARQSGDVQQAPGETPQSGHAVASPKVQP